MLKYPLMLIKILYRFNKPIHNGKKITKFILIIILSMITITVFFNITKAVQQCGGYSDDCYCGGYNPYPCCDNNDNGNDNCDGNCTWWAWQKACCNWGDALPGWSNAKGWADNAVADGYPVSSIPSANTIGVSSIGAYGHVAWVIEVSDDKKYVIVSEMNCWVVGEYDHCSGDYTSDCGYYQDYQDLGGGVRQCTRLASWFDKGYIYPKGSITPAPPPTLVYPPDNSTIYTTIPTFEWNSVPTADGYGLYIRDIASGEMVYATGEQPLYGTSLKLPGDNKLENGKSYWWNMNSYNSAGWNPDCCTHWKFTVQVDSYPTVDSFSVTPTSITLGDSFDISYMVSDDIGLQQTELWRVNDVGGEPGDWDTSYNPIFTKVLSGQKNYSGSFTDTPDTAGTYWYGMHVVDTVGNWSVEPNPPGPIMVTVTNPPTIEIISPSDGETVLGTVRFSSYASNDYGLDKVEFYMDDELKVTHGPFGPNTVASTCNWDCDTTQGSIDYIPNGNHTFKAKVYDVAGQTCVDTISFIVDNIVENQPPVADAGVNQTVHSGQVVWFDGSNSSDPDGTIVSYKWDFEDSGIATGCHTNHRFRGAVNESKIYAVTLTVEDGSGATATDSCDITVIPLQKTVKVTHQPSVPIPGVTVFAKMEVSYNWIYDDTYVISRIHYESGGFEGFGAISIWDLHSYVVPMTKWAADIFFSSEKTYSPILVEVHYGGDIFQGIKVDAFDAMNVYILGWAGISISIGPSFPAPFFKTNSACFQPDYTEVPEVPAEAPNLDLVHLCSPGEMRVYDPEGQVTGLVNGEAKEEIPYSAYNDNTVIILSPVDSYRYEVVGTDEGSYGLGVASVEDGEVTTFTATDIPTTSRAVHQYTIDWYALLQGEEGVNVLVDSDGDGKFEDTFTSDDELTQDEFLEETSPPPAFMLGDFGSANNGPPDCKVDFEDLMIFALAYGSTPSDANWNPVCDIASEGGVLEPDGVIDFEDLMIFAMNYGKTCADL